MSRRAEDKNGFLMSEALLALLICVLAGALILAGSQSLRQSAQLRKYDVSSQS